jgi:hypothetical protein
MKRLLLAALCCLAAQAAAATELEPGEWEFTSVSTSRLLPGPQTARFRRCIRTEEARNPDKWMAEPSQQGDCKVIPGKKLDDTYTWTMRCPHGNIRGSGSARLRRTSMEGETNMTGELQGQKFEIRTRVTGQRLGPCK